MKDKYIAQAPTQEEAVQKGLDELNITKDEAIIKVQEPGKKGFLGFGQKDAVVVVERKEKTNILEDILEPKPSKTFGKKDSQDMNQGEAMSTSDDFKESTVSESTFKDLAEDLADESAVQEIRQDETDEHKENSVEFTEEKHVESSNNADDTVPQEIVEAEQDQEAIDAVKDYLKAIILQMGIDDVEVYVSRVNHQVTYDIETEDAGLVIGRHGKVLNGLQTLAQNYMHQLAFNKIQVKVDAEKYRHRRKDTVEYLAKKTADKVMKTGRAVSLNPMPAHERKQIHRYLNHYPEISTHSEGKEPHRYLVVEPVKHDTFE